MTIDNVEDELYFSRISKQNKDEADARYINIDEITVPHEVDTAHNKL
jgi:hypothetical protein